jgi:hypothetical protein
MSMIDIREALKKTTGRIAFDDITHIDFSLKFEDNQDNLKEDLLQIEYPDQSIIDVGWYPSFNKKGEFQIRIIKSGDWETPFFIKSGKSIDELYNFLEEAIAICNEQKEK